MNTHIIKEIIAGTILGILGFLAFVGIHKTINTKKETKKGGKIKWKKQ